MIPNQKKKKFAKKNCWILLTTKKRLEEYAGNFRDASGKYAKEIGGGFLSVPLKPYAPQPRRSDSTTPKHPDKLGKAPGRDVARRKVLGSH